MPFVQAEPRPVSWCRFKGCLGKPEFEDGSNVSDQHAKKPIGHLISRF